MYFLVSANKSAYLGHTTSIIAVYQSLGLIWDLTALERNVFGLEGIADQQAVSTFCLFPQIFLFPHLSSFLCRYWVLPLQHCRLAHIIFLPLPLKLHTQLLYNHPPPSFSLPHPKPRQAGYPLGGPDGALACQPALGFWACRTAGQPFCGRYGQGQSWHLSVTMDQQGDVKAGTPREHCQYTADWGTNCKRTH